MTKSPVKALHALIDELNDAGKSELLTAMHTILLNQASAADADGDLQIDNLDDDDDDKPSRSSKKKRGNKSKDDDDSDDDDDDIDLGNLEVEDDDDDKPSKSKRRGKAAAEESDDDDDDDDAGDDDGDLPELKSAKAFNDFLDECDAFEFSPVDGGIRELTKRLQDEYGMDPEKIELPVSPAKLKKMDTKEIRAMKSEVFGATLAKFEHVTEQLVELGEKGIAAVAKAEAIDLDEVPGKGSRLVRNQALAIVGALYSGEDDGGDDEGDDD